MKTFNFQNIYDELIEKIPEDISVEQVICGIQWTMVKSSVGIGLSMTVMGNTRERILKGDLTKFKLKELAKAAKSWNMEEASIGVAAINAYYNTSRQLECYGIKQEDEEAFLASRELVKDKKVAVIGHFPYLEDILGKYCKLHILERSPLNGDYLDSACEYVLPQMDVVFITGVTLINKTLPRLLELAQNTHIVMVGPSVTMTPCLFNYGINNLAGYIVKDEDLCIKVVEGETTLDLFNAGQRVQLKA